VAMNASLRGDIFGGLTAGIVALPLGLAFGAASGIGPIAGVWSSIIVGFFAAIFGGTKSQITGPTGPVIVVFAGVCASFANQPEFIFAAVVLAGLMQIAFGFLHLGQYIRLVPYPVISGFMSGIGCIIILLQLPQLIGYAPDVEGVLGAISALPDALADPNWAALSVASFSLLIVFCWPVKLARIIPGALAALIGGTLLSLTIVGSPVLGEISVSLPVFVVPAVNLTSLKIVLEAALVIAALGSIESLLSSLVAENMTRTRHNSNQELIGQGIGNTIAGFFGVLPAAGATMRTVVNIKNGGTTKISGIIHSIILLIIVMSLAPLAAQIPFAVLAAILVKVGVDILDIAYLKRSFRGPRWDFMLMIGVLLLTIFVDLVTAVGVGVVFAALGFVKKTADKQLEAIGDVALMKTTQEEQEILERNSGRIKLFEFDGPLSFGAAADLGYKARDSIAGDVGYVVLDFSRISFIDISATRAIETIIEDAQAAHKLVYITNMTKGVRETFTGLDASYSLASDTFFDDRLEALRLADFAIQMERERLPVEGNLIFRKAAQI